MFPQKVAEIMDKESGTWSLEEIKDILPEKTIQAILTVPISQQEEGENKLIWPSNGDGQYTCGGFFVEGGGSVAIK